MPLAVETGNIELVTLLINSGADNLSPALKTSVENNNVELVALLLQYIPENVNSTLFLAIKFQNTELIELLLEEHNANIIYALELAIVNNDAPLVILLIEKGVDVNDVNDEGVSILEYALKKKNKDIIKLLKDAGAVEKPNKK